MLRPVPNLGADLVRSYDWLDTVREFKRCFENSIILSKLIQKLDICNLNLFNSV
jgi:hypothetical protein